MYEQLYTRLLWPVVLLFLKCFGWLAQPVVRSLHINRHLRHAMGPNSLVSAFLLLAGVLVMRQAQAQSPGGVGTTNLKVWLKADAGVTTSGGAVSGWTNQGTLASYNLTQATAGSRPANPTTGSQLVNFNPSIYFDGGNFLFNNTSFLTTSSPYTFLFVVQDEAADAGYRTVMSTGDLYDYFEFNKNSSTVGAASNGWNPYGVGGNGGGSGSIGDHGTFGKGTKYSPVGGANGYYNGTNFSSDSRTQHSQSQVLGFSSANSQASFGTSLSTWTDGFKDTPGWSYLNESAFQASLVQPHFFKNLSLGGDLGGNVEPWLGKINEVIILDRTITDLEAQQINTYLAIKYGVTLGQGGTNGYVGRNGNNLDYIASDGSTVVWSGATNSAYSYDITGIGRDDNGSLNQKQSKSINASGFVTLGNGTGIVASNAANANTFSATNSYELVGDNGQPTSYSTAYAAATYVPSVPSAFYRMARTWKVQETGSIGTVTISVPASSKAEVLLVSNSSAFTPGSSTTEITMTSDGSGNLTAQVNFANGAFFSFGATVIAPGGVSAALDLWLKADAITGASNNSVLNGWNSSAPTAYSLSSAGYTAPIFYNSTASNLSNFNPTVSFNGAMNLRSATRLYANTSPFSIIGVGIDRKIAATDLRGIMGIGDGNYPAMDFQTDGVSPNGWNPWMSGSLPSAEWTGGSARAADILGSGTTQANIVALTSANNFATTNFTADNIVSYLNGYKEATYLDAYQQAEIGNGVFVGSSGGENYLGLIPEVIAEGTNVLGYQVRHHPGAELYHDQRPGCHRLQLRSDQRHHGLEHRHQRRL
jgi:large repetitive protein